MEIKVGHVYFGRSEAHTSFLLVRIKKFFDGEFYLTTKIRLDSGNISDDYISVSDLIWELDPSIWDKAVKLHDVYLSSLKSLIPNKHEN